MDASILSNKKILITAGPTREAIDPVRYISNHSSGKMGYSLAAKFLELGAEVVLVSGPVQLQLQHPRIRIIKVNSADQMYEACQSFFDMVDIAIFAAAVADYKPAQVAEHKIKKDQSSFNIKMVKNVDIAAEFGKRKSANQLSIGFALETDDELRHAREKLQKKNFDMVILNSMNDANATFGHDTNKITIIKSDLSKKEFSLKQKTEVAKDIVREISSLVICQYQYENLVNLF